LLCSFGPLSAQESATFAWRASLCQFVM